jgi:Fe-S-cluster containining protein
MTCSQCGKCCRLFIPAGFTYGQDWLEYYNAHGFKVEYMDDGKGGFKPKALLIPVQCPHLRDTQEDKFECCRDEPRTYYCDIYETRPVLCRTDSKKAMYYKPEGCTNEQ